MAKWAILFLSHSIIFIFYFWQWKLRKDWSVQEIIGLCKSREVGEMEEKHLFSLDFTGSNSIFASAHLPPSSECVGFSLSNWSASSVILLVLWDQCAVIGSRLLVFYILTPCVFSFSQSSSLCLAAASTSSGRSSWSRLLCRHEGKTPCLKPK